MDPNEFVIYLTKTILPFLPVLFGGVEFLKSGLKLDGQKVTLLSIGIFVFYGALVILAYFFPIWATYVLGAAVFLLMCAMAPSGYYKFASSVVSKLQ